MTYQEFIDHKSLLCRQGKSIEVKKEQINQMLYEFQKDIVRWALYKGRSAIFADCGLGKTAMQLEWAKHVAAHTGGNVLILAPLSVADQTAREGQKFGVPVCVCASPSDVQNGVNITNYEKLDRFDPSKFQGVVLDESSILKSFTGATRNALISSFSETPFRLACTATPAPNDYMELGNHAEFLGVMTRAEMLSMFFVHDGGETSKWRLKGHAADAFWKFMGSMSVFVNNPSDLGYQEQGFDLPELVVYQDVAENCDPVIVSMSLLQRRQARRETLDIRCKKAADMANASSDQWLIWCDLNDESHLLHSLIPDSVEVCGSDSPEHKAQAMAGFSDGSIRCLVTKPSIAGFGMNWQQCHHMAFVGLSDSYEQYYQAVRRCWRFGQKRNVDVHLVISKKEGCVLENIMRKQKDCDEMRRAMILQTKEITKKELQTTMRISTAYDPNVCMILPEWREFVASH